MMLNTTGAFDLFARNSRPQPFNYPSPVVWGMRGLISETVLCCGSYLPRHSCCSSPCGPSARRTLIHLYITGGYAVFGDFGSIIARSLPDSILRRDARFGSSTLRSFNVPFLENTSLLAQVPLCMKSLQRSAISAVYYSTLTCFR